MKIMFVHQNYPGQFVHLAPALMARGHDVIALADHKNKNHSSHPVYKYKMSSRQTDFEHIGLSAAIVDRLDRGYATAMAAATIRDERHFSPDVIVGHPGWGETLFLKQVWPKSKLIVYAELMYRAHGLDTDFDPEFQPGALGRDLWITARQLPLLKAIDAADQAISPTYWQASSFPAVYRDRITIVHDGIDTDRIRPRDDVMAEIPGTTLRFRSGDEILTFVSRNLEPYRGYHIFIRALPKVLAERKNAHVILIGGDDVSYSGKPKHGKSWKQQFLDEVSDRLDMSRVHFVGRTPYATFVDLMTVTRVHAYLTYPFVLSWSMLEAMAAGALVVGSRTPPVEEVIKDGKNGLLVDFFDVDAWSRTLVDALAEPKRYDALRIAARATICDTYDLRSNCLPRLVELVEGAAFARPDGTTR
jgi:glycosyltransferase involved in cell wall biosynthesis